MVRKKCKECGKRLGAMEDPNINSSYQSDKRKLSVSRTTDKRCIYCGYPQLTNQEHLHVAKIKDDGTLEIYTKYPKTIKIYSLEELE